MSNMNQKCLYYDPKNINYMLSLAPMINWTQFQNNWTWFQKYLDHGFKIFGFRFKTIGLGFKFNWTSYQK